MKVEIIKKIDGRVDRNTGLRINSRLRVTAYCRVSTGDEEQLNSYKSQQQYYKEKINSNSEWSYVEIYADEAISGTLDYRRNDFMRMIQDAMEGKFDLIITKSISRFARNTVDTLRYVRLLKEKNIAVFFEEENINTLEMSGELLLTILSSVAQQESENISTHVKLGLKMKKERGELVGFNNCLGYHYDSSCNRMIIDEREAEVVRHIYNLYCEGWGAESIAKKLTEMKIKTPKGLEVWRESTVRKILKNEKYKGDVLQGKTYTLDPISHKRVVNMGEEDKYYIREHHDAIIEPEIFDRVQEMMRVRCGARATGRRLGNVGRKFTFSNRLRCGFCGEVLTRRSLYSNKKQTNPAWLCMQSAKYGKQYCEESKIIREDIIENAFIDAYQLLCNNNKLAVENFLKNMEKNLKENNPKDNISTLEIKKAELNQKIEKLLDFLVDGTLTNELYNKKKEQYEDKIDKIDKQIEQLELLVEDEESIERGMQKFKTIFEENDILNDFDKDVFDALVDYVIVGGYDESGQKDQYMLRFICKSQFELTPKSETSKDFIVKNNNIKISKMITILDFINKQSFVVFEKDNEGRTKKNIVDKIRVRVEMAF